MALDQTTRTAIETVLRARIMRSHEHDEHPAHRDLMGSYKLGHLARLRLGLGVAVAVVGAVTLILSWWHENRYLDPDFVGFGLVSLILIGAVWFLMREKQ